MYKFEKLTLREVEVMLGISLGRSRAYREIKQEGIEQATFNLVIQQLIKRFGELSAEIRGSISALPLPVMENLSEALLDFTSYGKGLAMLNPYVDINYFAVDLLVIFRNTNL
jgi:predicted transposase YdaD